MSRTSGTVENFEMQRAPAALKTEEEVEGVQDFFTNWAPQLGSGAFEEASLVSQAQQPKNVQLALEDIGTKSSGIPQFTFASSSASASGGGVPLPSGSLQKIDDALSWLSKAKELCNLVSFIHV